MAFISTGIGSSNGSAIHVNGGQQGSSMSQIVICNNSALQFCYDVFSEEPMEYVGSSYDDKFIVQLRELTENSTYVVAIESVNNSEWYPVVGVDFAGGDNTTFHTGKKVYVMGIPAEFIGKPVEISFIVCDVGDSAFDTAVVIDDVQLIN